MRHHHILLIVVLGSIVCFGRSYGQVNSPAFDPNCYFPRIGVPGEIDTIYGSHELQFLGSGMLNIGPSPGDSYGRMSCTFDYNNIKDITDDSIFSSGPTFNLHKANVLGNLVFAQDRYFVRFGYFRSPKYKDILTSIHGQGPARIYWQDDQGNYDSSRYTDLISKIQGKIVTDYSMMTPYSANISSDTVEDIIYRVLYNNTNTKQDSLFVLYFEGGEKLFNQGKVAIEDSSLFFDQMKNGYDAVWATYQGDFRGTGKSDLITADYGKNLFFYKNEKPFSLASFVYALKNDTLFSYWENPTASNQLGGFVMQAFRKSKSDLSSDFLLSFQTQYGSRSIIEIRIFKGGKDFGSQKWKADSATFILHEPYYYDQNYQQVSFGSNLRDCGDMTGTGNRVLYIEGTADGGFYGYHYFYVLGDAMDDKVDMFVGPIPNTGVSGGSLDTLTADRDIRQDILMGLGGFGLSSGNESNGTIYLIHGSKKIPVTLNIVQVTSEATQEILAYPNPATTGKCIIDFHSLNQQDLQINIWDLLGRRVYDEHIYPPFVRSSHEILIPSLSSGTYILEVLGKHFCQRIQVSVLR